MLFFPEMEEESSILIIFYAILPNITLFCRLSQVIIFPSFGCLFEKLAIHWGFWGLVATSGADLPKEAWTWANIPAVPALSCLLLLTCRNKNVETTWFVWLIGQNMEVSWNRATPKSSMSMIFSTINHPSIWGYPPWRAGNPHLY